MSQSQNFAEAFAHHYLKLAAQYGGTLRYRSPYANQTNFGRVSMRAAPGQSVRGNAYRARKAAARGK